MQLIKDLVSGDVINGPLLVNSVTKGVTDSGREYLSIVFQDLSGTLEAKKWDVNPEDLEVIVPGEIVSIGGVISTYKNNLQLKVVSAHKIAELSEEEKKRFYRLSPIPYDELIARLNKYLDSFVDQDVALITKTVINHFYDKYVTYPAAVRVHHEFGSGILHHSIMMADLADFIAKAYPNVDRDILVAGALLHDMGKVIEYEKPMTPIITKEGRLIGHISIFYAEYRKIVDSLNIQSEVPLLLGHMILAHHGKLEFGSPVLPMTMEATLLSMIDLLDSRVMIINKALDGINEGEFTPRQWALDDVMLYKPFKRNQK